VKAKFGRGILDLHCLLLFNIGASSDIALSRVYRNFRVTRAIPSSWLPFRCRG
jgi:hypothetical protein